MQLVVFSTILYCSVGLDHPLGPSSLKNVEIQTIFPNSSLFSDCLIIIEISSLGKSFPIILSI